MNDGPIATIPGGEYPDVGSRLSKAFSIYTSHPVPFIVLSAITLPLNILSSVWEWGWLLTLPFFFVGTLVSAALSHAGYDVILRRTPTIANSLGAAVARIGTFIEYDLRLIGTCILLFITIIGIPFAIRVLVRWLMGTQSIILYGDDAVGGISRSARLAAGNWWRIFGNLLLVGLFSIPGAAISFVIGGIAGAVISAVIGTLIGPLFAIFLTLLFLRLAQEKGEDPPPAEIVTQP